MQKCKYKAYYIRDGANPFSLRPESDDVVSITAEVSEDMPISEVEKLAKEATPLGYEFNRVEKLTSIKNKEVQYADAV